MMEKKLSREDAWELLTAYTKTPALRKHASFAAGVNRDVVRSGCEMLGVELDYIIRETIEGMKEKAAEIGLKGSLS